MHILHVIDGLVRAGAERMLVDIANATASDGHRVSVCVTRSNTDLADQLRPEIELLVLNRSRRFDWGAMVRFAAFVKQRHVDLLQVHGRSSFSFVAFLKTPGLIRTPTILHDHFGGIETNESIPRWFFWWGKYFLASYVGVYEKLGEWAARAHVPAAKIGVISNSLDLSRIQDAQPVNIREKFDIPSDCLVGVVVSSIRPEKGIEMLLNALTLSQHRGKIRILVIGREADQPYAQECRVLQQTLQLEQAVMFVGESPNVPEVIKGADFALMPSRSESGPLVLIEFMAASLPFVAFKVGGISHQVAQYGVPGFVQAADVQSFSKALDELILLSAEDRKQRGQMGQSIAQRYFEIHQVMPIWYEVYAKILRGKY